MKKKIRNIKSIGQTDIEKQAISQAAAFRKSLPAKFKGLSINDISQLTKAEQRKYFAYKDKFFDQAIQEESDSYRDYFKKFKKGMRQMKSDIDHSENAVMENIESYVDLLPADKQLEFYTYESKAISSALIRNGFTNVININTKTLPKFYRRNASSETIENLEQFNEYLKKQISIIANPAYLKSNHTISLRKTSTDDNSASAKKPTAELIALLFITLKDANILAREENETAEKYCRRACSKCNIIYRDKIRQWFGQGYIENLWSKKNAERLYSLVDSTINLSRTEVKTMHHYLLKTANRTKGLNT